MRPSSYLRHTDAPSAPLVRTHAQKGKTKRLSEAYWNEMLDPRHRSKRELDILMDVFWVLFKRGSTAGERNFFAWLAENDLELYAAPGARTNAALTPTVMRRFDNFRRKHSFHRKDSEVLQFGKGSVGARACVWDLEQFVTCRPRERMGTLPEEKARQICASI